MTNVGTILYILVAYFVVIILERLWSRLVLKCPRSAPYHRKLHGFLYWNAINTLAMEIYLDVGISSTLNVHTMKWLDNNPDLAITNVFAIICLIFIIGYPIWLMVFYWKGSQKWQDEEF